MIPEVKSKQKQHATTLFDGQYAREGKQSWLLRDDNKTTWSHSICLQDYSSFLKFIPTSKFLVLGDGNGAKEGRFIKSYGHHVTSCDWGTKWLEIALEMELIDAFCNDDMENLSFSDNEFDYCLVKESLHHLQRPYKCINDMYRISSKGIFIIEPNDHSPDNYKTDAKFTYEPTGNFKYEFNANELIKYSYLLGCNSCAYGFTNHAEEKYIKDRMKAINHNSGPKFLESVAGVYDEVKERNRRLKYPSRLPLLSFAMFKSRISPELINILQSSDFTIHPIKPNPYI